MRTDEQKVYRPSRTPIVIALLRWHAIKGLEFTRCMNFTRAFQTESCQFTVVGGWRVWRGCQADDQFIACYTWSHSISSSSSNRCSDVSNIYRGDLSTVRRVCRARPRRLPAASLNKRELSVIDVLLVPSSAAWWVACRSPSPRRHAAQRIGDAASNDVENIRRSRRAYVPRLRDGQARCDLKQHQTAAHRDHLKLTNNFHSFIPNHINSL